MHFRAILFDLDGTLLDTLEDLADSMNSVLKAHGFPTHPDDAYRYFVGDGVVKLVSRSLPESARDNDALVSGCVEAMGCEYSQRWAQKTRLYEGIAPLLNELEQMGLKKAILSNKPHELTQAMTQHYLKRWHFDVALGAQDSFPRKPDPRGAWIVAKSLATAPEEFLYVGDTNTDMQTADAAGMFAAGVLWGFRTEQELRESGARALVRRPLEMLSLLSAKQ